MLLMKASVVHTKIRCKFSCCRKIYNKVFHTELSLFYCIDLSPNVILKLKKADMYRKYKYCFVTKTSKHGPVAFNEIQK